MQAEASREGNQNLCPTSVWTAPPCDTLDTQAYADLGVSTHS